MTDGLRVGTRGSPLALAQTEEALVRLRSLHPEVAFTPVPIQTNGDEGYRDDLGTPRDGKRAFTKRIEEALLDREIDFAVHSMKDVPTDIAAGLAIAAVPARADPRDVFLAHEGLSLPHLPAGTTVGTSSLRRRAQLLAEWPKLRVVELHGNVGTRLRKLEAGQFDAVVLAAAGLHRLGAGDRRPQPLAPETVTPAPGQGALALECRSSDGPTMTLLRTIDDPESRMEVEAERALSARLEAGCNTPFGALAELGDGSFGLQAVVASPDGRRVIRTQGEGADPTRCGADLARQALEQGAAALIAEVTR